MAFIFGTFVLMFRPITIGALVGMIVNIIFVYGGFNAEGRYRNSYRTKYCEIFENFDTLGGLLNVCIVFTSFECVCSFSQPFPHRHMRSNQAFWHIAINLFGTCCLYNFGISWLKCRG